MKTTEIVLEGGRKVTLKGVLVEGSSNSVTIKYMCHPPLHNFHELSIKEVLEIQENGRDHIVNSTGEESLGLLTLNLPVSCLAERALYFTWQNPDVFSGCFSLNFKEIASADPEDINIFIDFEYTGNPIKQIPLLIFLILLINF